MTRIGFTFLFRNSQREAANSVTASQSIFPKSKSVRLDSPVKASSKIDAAADTIKPREADFRPLSAAVNLREFSWRRKKRYSPAEMQTPAKMHPVVASTAPISPAVCSPTKVEALTAKGPGVIWEIARISVKAFWDIQEAFSTISCWISGMTA